MNNLNNTSSSQLWRGMLTFFLFCPLLLRAQDAGLVSPNTGKGAFTLTEYSIVYDNADFTVVEKTAHLLAKDIQAVTGYLPEVMTNHAAGNVILPGTLEHSKMIDGFVSEGKLDVSGITEWCCAHSKISHTKRGKNPYPYADLWRSRCYYPTYYYRLGRFEGKLCRTPRQFEKVSSSKPGWRKVIAAL